MPVQQMPRMLFNNNVNRIEQSLNIAFLHKRCPKIWHYEIPHEHHPLIG